MGSQPRRSLTGRRRRRADAAGPDLRVVPDPPGPDLRSQLPELFDEHYRSLVRLAAFQVDDRETAEEVVQDAFVKLVGGNYRVEPGKEAGYLRSMVINGARSALRKRQVRRAHTPDEPGVVDAAEITGVANSETDRMLDALRQLPEKQSAVLMLRYYLDLSEAEIAETLDIARGSVKSHAHRGLKKLGDLLGQTDLDPAFTDSASTDSATTDPDVTDPPSPAAPEPADLDPSPSTEETP